MKVQLSSEVIQAAEGNPRDDSCVVALILYALNFIIQSKTEQFMAYAYGQQLYLQVFQTASSFIVNLKSSKPFAVITVFISLVIQ